MLRCTPPPPGRCMQAEPSWYCSTLGMSMDERLGGDAAKVKLLKWERDSFNELVAEKLMVRTAHACMHGTRIRAGC